MNNRLPNWPFKRIFDCLCEHHRQSNCWLRFNLYHGEVFRCGSQIRIYCRTFRVRSKFRTGQEQLEVKLGQLNKNGIFERLKRNRKRGWNYNDQWLNSDSHHRPWFRGTFQTKENDAEVKNKFIYSLKLKLFNSYVKSNIDQLTKLLHKLSSSKQKQHYIKTIEALKEPFKTSLRLNRCWWQMLETLVTNITKSCHHKESAPNILKLLPTSLLPS